MEIYDVQLRDEDRLTKPPSRLLVFLLSWVIYGAVYFAMEWLWPDQSIALLWQGHRLLAAAVKVGMMITPMSLLMTFWFSSKSFRLSITQPWQAYQIIIEDDQIRTRNFDSYNWMLSKTIERGSIKLVVEKEKGLLISSRDKLGTFLWGGIWIPKRLADYEYIKRLISNWEFRDAPNRSV
jgi:hypothetical protein